MKKSVVFLLAIAFSLAGASFGFAQSNPEPPALPDPPITRQPAPVGPIEDPNAPQPGPNVPIPAQKTPTPDPNTPIQDPNSPGMPRK